MTIQNPKSKIQNRPRGSAMKTIGVIGGLGPQATMDFEARVHAVSQELIPQSANSGYPPMVVYYHRSAPFVTDEEHRPVLPLQLEPRLTEQLGKLGQMADFIVITANGPHAFRDRIEEATGRKVLSMIEVTLQEVQRRGWRRLGVLGLGEPVVYTTQLDRIGLPYETLSGEAGGLRDRLDRAIVSYMAGQSGPESTSVALEAVDTLRARDVDGTILGCTEIPLLLGDLARAPDLVNPGQLLAEAAVRFALE
jgi:aspartate racemase